MSDVVKQLQKLKEKSPFYRVLFKELAARQRSRPEPLDLRRFARKLRREKGMIFDDSIFFDFFNELEKSGTGTVMRNNVGDPERFKFNSTPSSIGKAALYGKEDLAVYATVDRPPTILKRTRGGGEPVDKDKRVTLNDLPQDVRDELLREALMSLLKR